MKHSILLSSSRSGTNFFLNVYQRNYRNRVVLREIFRDGGDSFVQLERLTGLDRESVLALCARDPVAFWLKVKSACEAQSRTAMAKIFYYHQPKDAELWQHFARHDQVVHLIRANLFDFFVSRSLMQRTKRAIHRGAAEETESSITFTVDPKEVEQFIKLRLAWAAWARRFFADADYTEVFYENISASSSRCIEEMTGIFGPPSSPDIREATLQKQKRRSNAEIVENYDEVVHLDRPRFPLTPVPNAGNSAA